MNTLLYIALTNIEDDRCGVSKKVRAQCQGFLKNGYDVTCAAYNSEGAGLFHISDLITKVETFRKFPVRRYGLIGGLIKHLSRSRYDVCYIRYPYFDYPAFYILKLLKKCKTNVYLEIPSFPIQKLADTSPFKIPIDLQDKLLRSRLKYYVSKVVSIGNPVKQLFDVDVVNVPNGADLSVYPLKKHAAPNDELHIITVSSMASFHGYDRLIAGLAEYYRSNESYPIFIHMVGEGPEEAKYRLLVQDLNLSSYIKFYGSLTGEKLDNLYDKCQLACASLGLHREGYSYASPLKSKEFLARGIPYIYAYSEIGLPDDFPFLFQFEADDTPINLSAVAKFYEKLKDKYESVAIKLRNFALGTYDWGRILEFVSVRNDINKKFETKISGIEK